MAQSRPLQQPTQAAEQFKQQCNWWSSSIKLPSANHTTPGFADHAAVAPLPGGWYCHHVLKSRLPQVIGLDNDATSTAAHTYTPPNDNTQQRMHRNACRYSRTLLAPSYIRTCVRTPHSNMHPLKHPSIHPRWQPSIHTYICKTA
jgi:hypothetical protein